MIDKTEIRVRKLIEIIGEETKPRCEIMAELNLGGRRNFRVRYLNPAMERGFVRMLRSDSPNSPEQAYFVTQKGREFLRTKEVE